MAHYQGSAAEGNKARTLANEREEQQAQFKRKQEEIKKANEVKLLDMNDLFQSQVSNAEDIFKAGTVGLVSAAEFKKKRIELEEAQQAAEAEKKKAQEKERKRKGRERQQKMKALTFDMEEEEGAVTGAIAASPASSSAPSDASSSALDCDSSEPQKKKAKTDTSPSPSSSSSAPTISGKDPLADTSFLPDRAREHEESLLRAQLADQWKQQQEIVKQEQIQIVYSYWDGSGHRNKVIVTKGMTIGQFLEKARKDIVGEFHELRGLGGDGLIYIKEDLIIPHNYSFYDLIVTKSRGKSGPLFNFDVHDDVRMTIDAGVEKDESHAGKIVTKGWYERNKSNFPASRWETFDPTKTYAKYTIKGGEVRGAFAK